MKLRLDVMKLRPDLEEPRPEIMKLRPEIMSHRIEVMKLRPKIMSHRPEPVKLKTGFEQVQLQFEGHQLGLEEHQLRLERHQPELVLSRLALLDFGSLEDFRSLGADRPAIPKLPFASILAANAARAPDHTAPQRAPPFAVN